MNIVLLGAPGSGKGTQGVQIASDFDLRLISTGDLLRKEIKEGSVLGNQVKSIMESGGLVGDDLVCALIKSKIEEGGANNAGFILDGFPRTVAQAEMLDNLLSSIGVKLDIVLNFEISETELLDRILNRFFCSNCGANYNTKFKPTKVANICDECGGDKFDTRADDTKETVHNRFQAYLRDTMPLVSYYKAKNLLNNIDSNQGIDNVITQVRDFLQKHLD